ncbi:hypothetical protein AB4Z17_11675 [Paenibacillus sp. TAF43_2]|uniref:hypothetical protein n=1 Tax=Paenibacillus sp. TAF43_2 TaxID=3233069 RepID=UPI003F97F007
MRFVGIDPATNTGFVALDSCGMPFVEELIRGEGKNQPGGISPEQRMSLENQLFVLLKPGDVVLKEGVANGTQMLITTAKIHGGLEGMVTRKGLRYDEIAPDSVKKFVAVESWTGTKGSKVRLDGPAKKKAMAAAALEQYGYTNPSHDIVDAFIIAKICEAVYRVRNGRSLDEYPPHQSEVIESITDPVAYKAKKDAKKKPKPKLKQKVEASAQSTLF